MRKNVRFVHQKIVDFRSNSRKNSRNLHIRIDVLLSTVFSVFSLSLIHVFTVSHFSYAPLFQCPHFLRKMLESNIFLKNLLIDIFSV